MLAVETSLAAVPAAAPQSKPLPVWTDIVHSVEPFLERVAERLMAQADEFEPQIVAYAQYALTAQGKQLRPVLVALSGEAAGGLHNSHLTVAVIIEMVHLATLVHDDIISKTNGRPERCARLADIELLVTSNVTARIQEGHQFLFHTICELVEEQLQSGN